MGFLKGAAFVELLFDFVEVIHSAKGSDDGTESESDESADTELSTEVSE